MSALHHLNALARVQTPGFTAPDPPSTTRSTRTERKLARREATTGLPRSGTSHPLARRRRTPVFAVTSMSSDRMGRAATWMPSPWPDPGAAGGGCSPPGVAGAAPAPWRSFELSRGEAIDSGQARGIHHSERNHLECAVRASAIIAHVARLLQRPPRRTAAVAELCARRASSRRKVEYSEAGEMRRPRQIVWFYRTAHRARGSRTQNLLYPVRGSFGRCPLGRAAAGKLPVFSLLGPRSTIHRGRVQFQRTRGVRSRCRVCVRGHGERIPPCALPGHER